MQATGVEVEAAQVDVPEAAVVHIQEAVEIIKEAIWVFVKVADGIA